MQIITTLFPIGTDLTITTDGNVVARNTDHLNLCSFDNHNISVSCPSNSTLAMSTLPPADFNKELISSEFYSQFQNPFQTFISSLEILAFILSITNMLVYSQKRMRSPTSCYLSLQCSRNFSNVSGICQRSARQDKSQRLQHNKILPDFWNFCPPIRTHNNHALYAVLDVPGFSRTFLRRCLSVECQAISCGSIASLVYRRHVP